ncbi:MULTISPECIES: DUF6327 family protein [Salegentibacter]|jgi:hypothetical protein|uniref:Glutaminyl-tRNA synthetase n=1 Tax=Salegentibacter agarivorans TaxID=345907 RepID=A0A1I2MLL3_9FLAO|nr:MULTISPECIES: DUF6327 family protein [Salegentibacter]APS38117.1 glutaminyl-tRNA synthetase [Salegentibacter sp. T436]SFF90256.1 hypothetical protein SAMN04488033_11358 [Salegentibacter agarivorans]|tara:strand:- start:714 stop:947 length:234 start_codon:yes stop_codon:yes gene_type:complete
MKEYSSFKEIDRDLKILKLQTKIDQEEIKLNIERTKSAMSPLSLMGSMAGSILQKAFILKAVTKLTGLKKVTAKVKG